MPPYTSPGIPIHHRPLRPVPMTRNPYDPGDLGYPNHAPLEPSFVDLIAAIEQAAGPVGAAAAALGLLVAADRQMAGSPAAVIPARWQAVRISVANCTTPGSASRPRPSRTTSPMSGRRCAGSARSTTCRSRARGYRPSGRGSATGWTSRMREPALQLSSLLLGPRDQPVLGRRQDL